jgi:hypothetical protein
VVLTQTNLCSKIEKSLTKNKNLDYKTILKTQGKLYSTPGEGSGSQWDNCDLLLGFLKNLTIFIS